MPVAYWYQYPVMRQVDTRALVSWRERASLMLVAGTSCPTEETMVRKVGFCMASWHMR